MADPICLRFAQAEAIQRAIQPAHLPDAVERRELSAKVPELIEILDKKCAAAEQQRRIILAVLL